MYTLRSYLAYLRIFKQTLRSAGSNATAKHMEEVSLGVMFLMEAARKADEAFFVKPKGGKHTIRNAEEDVSKMVKLLIDNEVPAENTSRSGSVFNDPTGKGMDKLKIGRAHV